MSNALKKIEQFECELLKDMLEACTIEQRERFRDLFRYVSIEAIPKSKRRSALLLVERTLDKNERGMK